MSLENRVITTSVRERDLDLMLVQLIETSPDFRQWICDQFTDDARIQRFLSVSRSVETGNGESDIEFGIEFEDGRRVLLLIENKIDATVQERQAERYHERGTRYVKSGICDDYCVGIIAPSQYVTTAIDNSFGTVIPYEEVQDKVKHLTHDSVPFILQLLDIAIEKQNKTRGGYASITNELEARIRDYPGDLPPIEPYKQTNNLLQYRSNHPTHPDEVRYQIWLIGPADGQEAMIRLSIASDTPEKRTNRIQTFIDESLSENDQFEVRPHVSMDTVRTYVTASRDESSASDAYLTEIVSTFIELISYAHPKMVESDL